jgi:hypothetical protein
MALWFGVLLLINACTPKVQENVPEVNTGPEVTMCKG